MKVTLIDHTPDPEAKIGLAASICYDSKTDRESCIKRAAHCKDSGHLATLRFSYASLKIEGISRVCSHQIVRVAHAGILQKSQRYVKETQVKYINPPALDKVDLEHCAEWYRIQMMAEELYLHLVETKQMKKEDARFILPQGCETSLNMCMNFQGWRDFLKNRVSKHAQWEVYAVACEIQKQLHGIAPNIFDGVVIQ